MFILKLLFLDEIKKTITRRFRVGFFPKEIAIIASGQTPKFIYFGTTVSHCCGGKSNVDESSGREPVREKSSFVNDGTARIELLRRVAFVQ